MKLLYVINHIDWFWSHRVPLAKGAQNAGYDVHVAVHGGLQDKNLTAQNFTPHELPQADLLKTMRTLRHIMKTTKPDLVHAITLKYAFITGLAGLGLKTRFVFTIAGLGYLFSSIGLKPKILRTLITPCLIIAFRRADLIFQNPDDRDLLIKAKIAKPNQCHLIRGSGVDLKEFPHTPKTRDDTKNHTPIAFMPTRLVHDKGVAVFIEAAKLLQQKGINARYQIAGGVTDNNPLAISKQQMQNMIADSPVQWLGKVDNMPQRYAAADVIVYPSYYREGIPKVLLETCATGRPVITTDHPGCRETVHNGKNGILVPVKDAAATAQAMETILNNADMRRDMGIESRKRAEQEFDVDLIVEQTLAVYT